MAARLAAAMVVLPKTRSKLPVLARAFTREAQVKRFGSTTSNRMPFELGNWFAILERVQAVYAEPGLAFLTHFAGFTHSAEGPGSLC